jgi:hypothetical protein
MDIERENLTRRYDEDVITVNWYPATPRMAASCNQIEQGLPQDLVTIDLDAFLDRVYSLA